MCTYVEQSLSLYYHSFKGLMSNLYPSAITQIDWQRKHVAIVQTLVFLQRHK